MQNDFTPTATTAKLVRISDGMLYRMLELQRAYGYAAYCAALDILSGICKDEARAQLTR